MHPEHSFLNIFRFKDTEIEKEQEDEEKFVAFYEQRDYSEEKSIELQSRAKTVFKRAKELRKGIKMLPENLHTEFRQAIDDTIDSMTEDIQLEAEDIIAIADDVRVDTDNVLYALRRESEKYEKKIESLNKIRSFPLLGSVGEKSISSIYTALDELSALSSDTNSFYESILCSKNLVKDLARTEEEIQAAKERAEAEAAESEE